MGRVTRQLRGKEGLILEHKGPPNWRMEIKPQLISDVCHWWERGDLSTGASEGPPTADGPSCSSAFLFEYEESEVHNGEVTSLRSHGSL